MHETHKPDDQAHKQSDCYSQTVTVSKHFSLAFSTCCQVSCALLTASNAETRRTTCSLVPVHTQGMPAHYMHDCRLDHIELKQPQSIKEYDVTCCLPSTMLLDSECLHK